MRNPRVILILLLLVFVIGISAFFVLRARGNEESGPPIAFCPGPDEYGYRCEPGSAYAYIDATNDTGLYEDDGVVRVPIPFSFTYYGQSYQEIVLSSNGILQFTTQNPAFSNECLNEGPVQGMGEMIAPYWDDLDLTLLGYLETAVTGENGSRIFVIEWDDVPSFANPDDKVTFEVQLHEGSNDIVFLYWDVTRTQGNSGSSATIGLQSELLGNSLQRGCDQITLTNGLNILFSHPDSDDDAEAYGRPDLPQTSQETLIPKGDMALIQERLNRDGINGLQAMSRYWLAERIPRILFVVPADWNGDGQDDLIVMLRPPAAYATQTQLAVFSQGEGENWQMIYQDFPLARQEQDETLIGRYYSLETASDFLGVLPPFNK